MCFDACLINPSATLPCFSAPNSEQIVSSKLGESIARIDTCESQVVARSHWPVVTPSSGFLAIQTICAPLAAVGLPAASGVDLGVDLGMDLWVDVGVDFPMDFPVDLPVDFPMDFPIDFQKL